MSLMFMEDDFYWWVPETESSAIKLLATAFSADFVNAANRLDALVGFLRAGTTVTANT